MKNPSVNRLYLVAFVLMPALLVAGFVYCAQHQALERTQERVAKLEARLAVKELETKFLRGHLGDTESRLMTFGERLESMEQNGLVPQGTRKEVLRPQMDVVITGDVKGLDLADAIHALALRLETEVHGPKGKE